MSNDDDNAAPEPESESAWVEKVAMAADGFSFAELDGLRERLNRPGRKLSQTDMLEMLEWLQENGMLTPASAQFGREERYVKLAAEAIRMLEYLYQHPGIITIFALLYGRDIDPFDQIIGYLNQEQFADMIGVSRQAVCKAVKRVQEHFGWPPRRDQRKLEQCQTMKVAREKQIKRNGAIKK